MDYKDYYNILGVSKTASADEIKKSYRKLTAKYHPDKNPGDKKAEDKFKDVSEAYDVLSNAENRKRYDELGANWKHYQEGAANGRGGQDFRQWYNGAQGGGQQYQYSNDDFGGSGGGFSDFFENIFGSRTRQERGPRRGQDLQAAIDISLMDAYSGITRTIQLQSGPLNLKLKPGIADGQTLKLKGKGAPGKAGSEPGDLFLTIRVTPDARYERRGDDLYINLKVDAITAITGGKVAVTTPGKTISMNIPEGTEGGKTFRLKDMGMPVYGQPDTFGAAYARVELSIPKGITQAQREALKELFNPQKTSHA